MTGYTVHTGTSEKFSAGWDHIFAAGKAKKAKKEAAASDKKAEKKTAKASSEKKKSAKKVKHGK